jgi:hypothetical protein
MDDSEGANTMARKKSAVGADQQPPPPIHPDGVYTSAQAAHALGLSPAAFKAARRVYPIRRARRANRFYYLGRWLADWVGEGELPAPKARRPAPNEREAAKPS